MSRASFRRAINAASATVADAAGITMDESGTSPDDTALLQCRLELSRKLRKQRLLNERSRHGSSGSLASRPDIYFEQGPDGPYPIIAFRTVPCDLYLKGYCAPCSYSARPWVSGQGREQLHASIMTQLEWVLRHFDELFVKQAAGRLEGYKLRHRPRGAPVYMMQLAGESSFFRDDEVPPHYRRLILERLDAFARQHGLAWHLMLETRAEHLLAAAESGELDELSPLLQRLNVVVNLGLETADDWLREHVFMKRLSRDVFERSVHVAQGYGLDPGIFIYPGLEIFTEQEMLEELDNSLNMLQEMGTFVNVMMPNLQAWTIQDVLYEADFWRLPEPAFLLDVLERLLNYAPARQDPITPFSWFLGGLVSDPEPRGSILKHPKMGASESSARLIHDAIIRTIRTGDVRPLEHCRKLAATQHSQKTPMLLDEITWMNPLQRLHVAMVAATQLLKIGGYRP